MGAKSMMQMYPECHVYRGQRWGHVGSYFSVFSKFDSFHLIHSEFSDTSNLITNYCVIYIMSVPRHMW